MWNVHHLKKRWCPNFGKFSLFSAQHALFKFFQTSNFFLISLTVWILKASEFLKKPKVSQKNLHPIRNSNGIRFPFRSPKMRAAKLANNELANSIYPDFVIAKRFSFFRTLNNFPAAKSSTKWKTKRVESFFLSDDVFITSRRHPLAPICSRLDEFSSTDGFHSEKLGNYWNMKRNKKERLKERKFEFSCRKTFFLPWNPLKFYESKKGTLKNCCRKLGSPLKASFRLAFT